MLDQVARQPASDSLPDGPVVSAQGAGTSEKAAASELAAPSAVPAECEDTVRLDEFDRLFGAKAPQVELTHSVPDAPVHVEQIAARTSAQEFSLPKPPAPERPRWYGPTHTVEVRGLVLPGLLSVALKPPPKGVVLHPATVAAWMPADLGVPTDGVEPIRDVWSIPSYASLTVAQRGLYLKWLASGRELSVPAHLALLFVCGLESRVVEAGPTALADEERRAIAWASRDVVARFGSALPQLREHCLNLAGFLDAVDAPARWYLLDVPELAETYDPSAPLQVALGQAARDGAFLPPAWALASVLSDVRVPKKTPVGRCPEEMRELFCIHFQSAFPKGLKVERRPFNALKVVYRGTPDRRTGAPASTSVVVPSADQTWFTQDQVQAIREAFDRCADELSAYSRFIGRMPIAKGTPDAEVRLPLSLLRRRLAANFEVLSASLGRRKEVSLDQAWMALWGKLPERKDSTSFLRALLEAEGLTVVATLPVSTQRAGVPSPPGRPFRLDPERLERVRKDEAAATKLLSALFTDTAEQATPASPATVHVDPDRALFPQLDDDHFRLLISLLNADAWTRERLKQAASQLGLMLDGALEVINDAAFELTGGPLVVDNGDLGVDSATARQIGGALVSFRQALR
ncbi:TerB N- and C- terminal domain-containing protein [Rubrivivax gelatinosus]|uniref:TerB N- and C- terminal domain-containing protein n=1 Tax=Rubrivivax gelatinosus TaxID=28068 RepID=UPI0002DFD6A8|nr:TerB N-terminal domain-containing protein [Rubrivivax gelatinosus]